MEFLDNIMMKLNLSESFVEKFGEAAALMFFLLLAWVSYFVVKKIVLKKLEHFILNNKYSFDNILLKSHVFSRASQFVPLTLINLGASFLPTYQIFIRKVLALYVIGLVVLIFDALLNALNEIYKRFEVSKSKPIKSYLQVIKIVIYIMGGIIFFANLLGKSPIYLLSGFGAMTAVLMLVFKDSILGLVAGIQLAANDMVQIGDWIEMPKYGADGDVIDISLNTVKVENFDRTITTIPTYILISDSFKNWRGMAQSGGRRIKRSLLIDVTSIRFATNEELERFKKISCISEYISSKEGEIKALNESLPQDEVKHINGRQLTNIGIFRAYVQKYLERNPKIHKEMIVMARQLPPLQYGVPIEVYCFTNDTNWIHYETIQADIFDHLMAVLPSFGLKMYQGPQWGE